MGADLHYFMQDIADNIEQYPLYCQKCETPNPKNVKECIMCKSKPLRLITHFQQEEFVKIHGSIHRNMIPQITHPILDKSKLIQFIDGEWYCKFSPAAFENFQQIIVYLKYMMDQYLRDK